MRPRAFSPDERSSLGGMERVTLDRALAELYIGTSARSPCCTRPAARCSPPTGL